MRVITEVLLQLKKQFVLNADRDRRPGDAAGTHLGNLGPDLGASRPLARKVLGLLVVLDAVPDDVPVEFQGFRELPVGLGTPLPVTEKGFGELGQDVPLREVLGLKNGFRSDETRRAARAKRVTLLQWFRLSLLMVSAPSDFSWVWKV